MTSIQTNDIGMSIRNMRKAKDMTLAALGEIVGVSGQAIYQYEVGKRSLGFDMIEKIAHALSTSIDDLLMGHNFIADKSKKIKPVPVKWSAILSLKELLLPSDAGSKDEVIEEILQDYSTQMFLYGFFIRLKNLNDTDRYALMQHLTEIIEKDVTIHELESVNIVASRLHYLNHDGLAHINRLIEDASELPRYKKASRPKKLED